MHHDGITAPARPEPTPPLLPSRLPLVWRSDRRQLCRRWRCQHRFGQELAEPLHTITSKSRFGLVTIRGVDYQIVDIGMRMLEPHELYRCQGFPEGYKHRAVGGKELPKYAQVRMVGNSVPPDLARALVEANVPRLAIERREAA